MTKPETQGALGTPQLDTMLPTWEIGSPAEGRTEHGKRSLIPRGRLISALATMGTLAFAAPAVANEAGTGPVEAHLASVPVLSDGSVSMTATFNRERGVASVDASDIASGKVTILGNIRAKGTPRKLVAKAEKNGDCFNVDGKKQEVWTKGLRSPRMKGEFGRDYRKSRACEIGGKIIRIICHNEMRLKQPKKFIPGKVIFVKNIAKVNLDMTARAEVVAQCGEENSTSAFARASATAFAYGSVSLKSFIKTKGNSASHISGEAYAEARARATAKVVCQDQSKIVIVTPPPEQPPSNQPPTGEANPSLHRFVNEPQDEGTKECVDNIRDPNGDRVEARDFRFTNEQGQLVGGITSGVFLPNLNDPGVQCVMWNAGTTPQSAVRMSVTLDDGHGNTPRITSQYTFPVLERPS